MLNLLNGIVFLRYIEEVYFCDPKVSWDDKGKIECI